MCKDYGCRLGAAPSQWREAFRADVRGRLTDFINTTCLGPLEGTNVAVAGEVLSDFVDGGKYVRSTFMYLG